MSAFKSINRLSINAIGNIQFDLIPYEQQIKIGDMYKLALQQEYLMKRQGELMKEYTLGMIQKINNQEGYKL